jgi:hypothetical protein
VAHSENKNTVYNRKATQIFTGRGNDMQRFPRRLPFAPRLRRQYALYCENERELPVKCTCTYVVHEAAEEKAPGANGQDLSSGGLGGGGATMPRNTSLGRFSMTLRFALASTASRIPVLWSYESGNRFRI